jgi:hypothetical protein
MVDDEDFEWLNQWKWSVNNQGYAHTIINKKSCKMHVIIMEKYFGELPKGIVNDHINNDKINNCKSNLRRCTFQENTTNRIRHASNETSKYKGVNYRKDSGLYRVRIMANGKQVSIGQYATEIEAAIAYNEAAKIYHGDFAYLNIIPSQFENIVPLNVPRSRKKVS